ncbi:hypothetical protein GGR21_002446 [Dysgonomonas hofstadii]|uniref:Uncharacterized protein n=1 Tax=Dysgonomonas hofstadii TaxID=637886 RepID=A0A840CKN4_9BACT|nr:hypothetical protein [Dysgonomonas hofstadii]MBB4036540.1 hypothetical protein [Dysgonomonas hofstadii]
MSLQAKIENALPKDKLMHFCIGLLLTQLAYLWVWLILLPVIAGLIKELYDRFVRKTGFDWWDILATVLGCVPVGIVIFIIRFME